jgi:hypothetical protein
LMLLITKQVTDRTLNPRPVISSTNSRSEACLGNQYAFMQVTLRGCLMHGCAAGHTRSLLMGSAGLVPETGALPHGRPHLLSYCRQRLGIKGQPTKHRCMDANAPRANGLKHHIGHEPASRACIVSIDTNEKGTVSHPGERKRRIFCDLWCERLEKTVA